jgi:hypothetical protein
MVYVPTVDELSPISETEWPRRPSLPIMLYNNPPAYRVVIDIEVLEALRPMKNIVAVKESAPDPRRFTDFINAFGDRYIVLMAGLDDVALEGLLLGAQRLGFGPHQRFPEANRSRWSPRSIAATTKRRSQSIAGSCRCSISMPSMTWSSRSSSPNRSWAAAPSACAAALPLEGQRRADVIAMVEKCAATRPSLSIAQAA